MIDAIETVRAQELMEMGDMVAVSVAAGIAMAGGSMSKAGAEQAIANYNQWMSGKRAVVTGMVGFDVDEHGVPILRSAEDIRRWFKEKGNLEL